MKMKKILFAFISLAVVGFIFWIIGNDIVRSSENGRDLILKVSSDKETYILGEIINLEFEVKDKNNKTFTLRSIPTVEVGYMHVWIASADRNFKEYEGPKWGLSDGNKLPETASSFKSQATILFNRKPAQQYSSFPKTQIETTYAIPEPGVYFIKATATIYNEEVKSDNDKIVIESEPIRIVINNPAGEDAEVWNLIKDNVEFAFFMHKGSFISDKFEEREKLVKEVERITAKYPTSILAIQMKQNIAKYRELEEVIKESKKNQNNQEKKP